VAAKRRWHVTTASAEKARQDTADEDVPLFNVIKARLSAAWLAN
jgi:hypothetical protein